MKAVLELEREGYEIGLQGDRVQIRRKVGFNPTPERVRVLLQGIREHKAAAVQYLRRCRWSVWCDRREPARWVSYPVCEYHLMMDDPVCQGCRLETKKRMNGWEGASDPPEAKTKNRADIANFPEVKIEKKC